MVTCPQNPSGLYLEDLGVDQVKVASPGFGAAANSFMDFVNAKELYPNYRIPHGIHRKNDPGAGAFTYYHGRATKASVNITPGEELFVSYGNHWFLYRKKRLGPIPVRGDHESADAMYRKYRQILEGIENKTSNAASDPTVLLTEQNELHGKDSELTTGKNIPPPTRRSQIAELGDFLWDTFVLGSPWDDSPTMAALPHKEDYDEMYQQSLIKIKKSRLFRDAKWLQENGVCADTMHMGESTIRQAGHGAFASRRLRQNTIVLPIPLIHIPNRKVLNMYGLTGASGKSFKRDVKEPTRPQLLLNYCMGHRNSTLLLSPYGPVFNLINHNQTLVNVRIQWASPERSQHNPDLLNMTINELSEIESSQLAMELVALRDIEAGEEIFLDYGDEWEAAWQKHVREWKPVEAADTYISAFEMNLQLSTHTFRTEFEQMRNPYPPNLMLKCHNYFLDEDDSKAWIKNYPNPVTKPFSTWMESKSVQCDILKRKQTKNRTLYEIMVPNVDSKDDGKWKVFDDIPQEAIFFQDRPYSTDMFLENAFRHDLRIPDSMFPEKWMNVRLKKSP